MEPRVYDVLQINQLFMSFSRKNNFDEMSAPIVEDQIATLQLLEAMYPLPSELILSPESRSTYDALLQNPASVPDTPQLEFTIRVDLYNDERHIIELSVVLYLILGKRMSISIRQPDFLPRTAYEELLASLPIPDDNTPSSEIVLLAVEDITSRALQLVNESQFSDKATNAPSLLFATIKLERVWFWFPSLSTKEKRKDLVEYAPRFGLTGFVLAGKPGLLCLEGDSRQVDRYMAAIKSESWGDIPSYQKKVTERLRTPLSSDSDRCFRSMTEITSLIPQHGVHNNRGEMSEVRRLMESWGVGDDFGSVVLNNGS